MTHDITNTVSRFFAAVDSIDWDAVQALMTDPFHVDYSSYTGADPSQVSPADLTGSWAEVLPLPATILAKLAHRTNYGQTSNRRSPSCRVAID